MLVFIDQVCLVPWTGVLNHRPRTFVLSPPPAPADTVHNVTTLADARPIAPADAAPRAQPVAEALAQSLVTALLYALPALICVYAACVTDPDIWWHLHTGDWILHHRAVPHTDPFGTAKPWAAYSWLYEVLVASLFARLSLVGIVAYTAAMVLLITAAIHRLVCRLCADFNLGVLLTFIASIAIGRLSTPRPWLFTILFFVLELDILLTVRRSGRLRPLLWLPILFALWANLHIQFIDGLLVLALATAEAIAAPWWPAARTRLTHTGPNPGKGALALTATLLASLLATLLNPYGTGIYNVAHDLATQPEVLDLINELKPIPFRSFPDYCVLALALAATALLARSRRIRPFETALLAIAFFLSFRSLRDVWFIAAVSTAIIAQQLGASDPPPTAPPHPPARPGLIALTLTPALTALTLFLGCTLLRVDNATLRAKLSAELPVDAATFILRAHYHGPVFNTYGWGGYLMWSLHQPVAVDGRAALQGTEHLDRVLAIWNLDAPNAQPTWASDPELARAGIVIGPVNSPLFQVLRLDPRFTLAYQDRIATVFIPSHR